ncbi:MAG: AAA family ATPase [Deferrisomatales bacterium]
MRRVIALANQKGGVGKTASAVNLAAVLGEAGAKVLVVDLDPQGSASLWLGVEDNGTTLLGLLERPGDLSPAVEREVAPGVDLIPGGLGLAAADLRLGGKIGQHTRLRRCLQRTPNRWDWILLDCPPALGALSVNALAAATGVLVPVEASPLALAGLSDLSAVIDDVREELNNELQVVGVLICRVNPRRIVFRETREVLENAFPGKVAPLPIRENVSLTEAPGHGQPITSYAPDSNGAQDYRAAGQWLREVV